MRIAAELVEAGNGGECNTEMGEELLDGDTIVAQSARTQRGSECLDLGGKELFKCGRREFHGSSEVSRETRCWTALAYSRQTSCGKS